VLAPVPPFETVRALARFPRVRVPMLALVVKRFVELAVVAKKLVVVAEVPVAFKKVKFCNVLEPVASKLEAVNVPVNV